MSYNAIEQLFKNKEPNNSLSVVPLSYHDLLSGHCDVNLLNLKQLCVHFCSLFYDLLMYKCAQILSGS